MPMSKKDYEAIARVFARMNAQQMTNRERTLVNTIVGQLAGEFNASSSSFKIHTFLDACACRGVEQ